MWKRTATLAILVCVLGLSSPASTSARSCFTGRVAGYTGTTLFLSGTEVGMVTIDHRTAFTKWITERPYGAETRLDARWLRIGELVRVHARSEDRTVADWIQIATDAPLRVVIY